MHYFINKKNIYQFDSQIQILYIIQCVPLSLIDSAVNWLAGVGRLQRLLYEMFAFVDQIEIFF